MRRVVHWLGVIFFLCSAPVLATETVHVGASDFPPYVMRDEQQRTVGLLPQLLDALNQLQNDYQFVLLPTAIVRRFDDLRRGRIDMAIFENPEWGWQGIETQVVDMGLEDAELFVALADASRDEGYFDTLAGKRLALYRGYHYGFADFNSDPQYLAAHFNVRLGQSHDSNLLMVLRRRADIALVTRSNLYDFLRRNPEYQGQLLISRRVDQRYRHHALLRPGSPVSAEVFAGLLQRLRNSGDLSRIFEPYQIAVSSPAADSSTAENAAD